MMNELLNFMPHDLVIYDATKTNEILRIKPSGEPIRLVQASQKALGPFTYKNIEIPTISEPEFIDISQLPPPSNNSVVVSAIVAEYLVENDITTFLHIFAPDTSPAGVVRNASGEIINTTRLVKYF